MVHGSVVYTRRAETAVVSNGNVAMQQTQKKAPKYASVQHSRFIPTAPDLSVSRSTHTTPVCIPFQTHHTCLYPVSHPPHYTQPVSTDTHHTCLYPVSHSLHLSVSRVTLTTPVCIQFHTHHTCLYPVSHPPHLSVSSFTPTTAVVNPL